MSSFNDNLKILKDKKKGLGVVAKADLPKDTIIFEFKGDIVKEIPKAADQNYYLQIGENNFLSPSGALDDIVNHSCNPNCGVLVVGNRAFLITIQLIKAGAEITFDYSTTSTDTLQTWKMDCKCGSNSCRKVISGYSFLPETTKKHYQSLKIIPTYLKDT